METVKKGPSVSADTRVPLTGILEELGCNGDPAPLAIGDSPKGVVANQLVCHVAQTQLRHDCLYLEETQSAGRLVTAGWPFQFMA